MNLSNDVSFQLTKRHVSWDSLISQKAIYVAREKMKWRFEIFPPWSSITCKCIVSNSIIFTIEESIFFMEPLYLTMSIREEGLSCHPPLSWLHVAVLFVTRWWILRRDYHAFHFLKFRRFQQSLELKKFYLFIFFKNHLFHCLILNPHPFFFKCFIF